MIRNITVWYNSFNIRVYFTGLKHTQLRAIPNLQGGPFYSLQWRHNDRNGVSNHHRLHWLLKDLFGRKSKKTSKLRITGLCAGKSPVTDEFPAQKASDAENVSIWWRHHEHGLILILAWISTRMASKVWDEITYPSQTSTVHTVDVWEWMSNFIPHFIIDVIIHPCRTFVCSLSVSLHVNPLVCDVVVW